MRSMKPSFVRMFLIRSVCVSLLIVQVYSQGGTTPIEVSQCPSDISTVSGRHVAWTEPNVSADDVTVTKTHSPGIFVTQDTSVEYSFSDTSGNTGSCRFNINIIYDVVRPVITSCPNDIKASLELGTSSNSVYWPHPSATDDNNRVTLLSSSHTPGQSFPVGITNIEYVFVDDSYNEARCTFSISVTEVDTTSPTVEYCPDDITQTVEIGESDVSVSWTEPEVYDASNSVTVSARSRTPRTFTPGRETRVSYVFVDESGNEEVCEFFVNVLTVDTTPPIIHSCPADVTGTMELGSLGIPVTWNSPWASDASGIVQTNFTHTSGELFQEGTTLVKYHFVDGSSNQADCTFVITVNTVDTKRPEVKNCPGPLIYDTLEPGKDKKEVTWEEPVATDFSDLSVIQTHHPGDSFRVGEHVVAYQFTDASNNFRRCRFIVDVGLQGDTIPPTIEDCPTDITETVESGVTEVPVSWTDPRATDDSGNVTLSLRSNIPTTFKTGRETLVNYIFVDASGNEANCEFFVYVAAVDTTPPIVHSCPADLTGTMELGSLGIPVLWSSPWASDASGIVQTNFTHTPGELFQEGTTLVKYHFVDGSFNQATCTFVVTVNTVDTTRPEVNNCPGPLIYDTLEPGQDKKAVTWEEPVATDYSDVTITQTHHPGDSFPVGEHIVVYIFTDASNNRNRCRFFVDIGKQDDTIPPKIEYCPSDITETVESGVTDVSVTWTEPRATDDSGNVTLSLRSRVPKTFAPDRETRVNYIFVDTFGNEANCEFFVYVAAVDKTPPKIHGCPEDITATMEIGSLGVSVVWDTPWATDYSGIFESNFTHISGEIFSLGVSRVKYFFQDGSSNHAECSFNVMVEAVDTTKPVFQDCPVDIYDTLNSGEEKKQIFWDPPTASDNSGNVTLADNSHNPGAYFLFGETKVYYKFTDSSGNTKRCVFFVSIHNAADSFPPTILYCPLNIRANSDTGRFGTIVTWQEPRVQDDSGIVMTLIQTHEPESFFTIGTARVTYIFLDEVKNMAKCSFTVTVVGDTTVNTGNKTPETQHLKKQEVNKIYNLLSIVSIALSVLVIVFIIVVILYISMLRKRGHDAGMQLEGLSLSRTSSFNSVAKM